uniref:FAS1 domain-containing protein n=1 Tax=Clastoptera arizonana TaxID=38151 RepID=A0A1B6D4C3_9HEMI
MAKSVSKFVKNRLSVVLFFYLSLNLPGIWARGYGNNFTLEQKIRDDTDLSQFYILLEKSEIAKFTILHRSCTVFAPSNNAFQYFTGVGDETLLLYHMTNSAQTLNQLSQSLSSDVDGNAPIWITRKRGATREDIYVNNAKINIQKSNLQFNSNGKRQVLHIIDSVLEPLRPLNKNDYGSNPNPNALGFLNQSERFDIAPYRIRSFRQRVHMLERDKVFEADGRFTFFIPVDEGGQQSYRTEKIDQKVIDGHVIPKHVLFTSSTPDKKEYETLAFTDNIKVTLFFETETDNKGNKTYIKSSTKVGDQYHITGVVLAEVVKANIPVKNGVVHLINKPLMVVDSTVKEFLESFKGFDREDGPLYKFYEVIRDVDGDFMERITKMKDVTLFAPSNSAWRDSKLTNLLQDKSKIRDILNMHLVEEKLPLEKIIYYNKNEVPTQTPRKKLYFNVIMSGNNKTLTVEGGGVNATVIQPDIAATNGFVHIIDRVLGVPFTTVGRKLATDPMLNKTNELGKYENFNDQLDDPHKHYTYFVPRDFAWGKMEARHPSAHKKIFMNEFGYHVKQILERHLVADGRSYTMAELKRHSNDTITLPSFRDVLNIRVKENDKSYYIEWENEWIHVFRPDVECTNGIIHVIDGVFIKESDIQVNSATKDHIPSLGLGLWTLFALCISLITARML